MNIANIVNEIIHEAFNQKASDIHFQPQGDVIKILFRVQTKLLEQKTISPDIYVKIVRYMKFKTRLDIANTTKPQDGAYSIITKNKEKLFIRISTMPAVKFESLVIRILPDKQYNLFEEIALFPKDLENIYESIKNNNGLFIFTGPTGSGKTTSMHSILDKLARDGKKILTLENPVEIINHNLVQINISDDLNINYSDGLKYAMRQDPDIIMIGEIRDEETARNVFRAALTGHTVISTMHTKNKYGVIERFLDFGFLISEIESILIGISNQRLVVDSNGKTKSFFDYAIDKELIHLINEQEKQDIYEKMEALQKKKIIV